jgi:hypothetical protein
MLGRYHCEKFSLRNTLMQRFTSRSAMRLHTLLGKKFVSRCASFVALCFALAAAPMASAITAASLAATNLAGKTLTFSIVGGNAPFETVGNFDLVLSNTGTYTIPVSNGNATLRSGTYSVTVDSFGTVLKLNGYVVNNSTVEVVIIPNSSPDRSSFEMYATGTNKNGNVVFATSTTSTTTPTTTAPTTAPTTTPSISSDAQSVFDLAAELYPTLFTDGSALGNYEGYVYKYFASSKIYVGIKDDLLYTLGGEFGNTITKQGTVANVLASLKKTRADKLVAAGGASNNSGSPGLTLSPAFNGLASIANSVPTGNGRLVGNGTSLTYVQGTSGLSIVYGDTTSTPNTPHVITVSLIRPGATSTSLNAPISLGGSLISNSSCVVSASQLYPLCSSLGIVFNSAAGTVSFTNTPMSASGTTLYTLTGVLTFKPF